MGLQESLDQLTDLNSVIQYMEATAEDSWQVDSVRSSDGSTNCFFGHLFNMGVDDKEGSHLWNAFEELWATTYMLYPVNDGEHRDYQQATPKQRVLAYLRDLQSGASPTTMQLMEAEFAYHEANRG